MSDQLTPSKLRSRGQAQRREIRRFGPVAPWSTVIIVTAVTTNHGRQSTLPNDELFEVCAQWHGPAAHAFPRSIAPVSGNDAIVVDKLDHALRIARRAKELFGQGGDMPPDLRDLQDGHRDLRGVN